MATLTFDGVLRGSVTSEKVEEHASQLRGGLSGRAGRPERTIEDGAVGRLGCSALGDEAR